METVIKMTTRLALIISLITVMMVLACSSTARTFKPQIICDKVLCPYVETVLAELNARHIRIDPFKRLIIRVGRIKEGYAGLSTEFFEPERYIYIAPFSLRMYDKNQILALMAHEIGHSLLHRKHDDRKIDGIARSIMISSVQSRESYIGRMDEYFEELFSVTNNIRDYGDTTIIRE